MYVRQEALEDSALLFEALERYLRRARALDERAGDLDDEEWAYANMLDPVDELCDRLVDWTALAGAAEDTFREWLDSHPELSPPEEEREAASTARRYLDSRDEAERRPTMPKITIDEEAIIDLLVEIQAISAVLEQLSGTGPTRLTLRLEELVEPVAEAALGDRFDHEPRFEALMELSEERARELLAFERPVAIPHA